MADRDLPLDKHRNQDKFLYRVVTEYSQASFDPTYGFVAPGAPADRHTRRYTSITPVGENNLISHVSNGYSPPAPGQGGFISVSKSINWSIIEIARVLIGNQRLHRVDEAKFYCISRTPPENTKPYAGPAVLVDAEGICVRWKYIGKPEDWDTRRRRRAYYFSKASHEMAFVGWIPAQQVLKEITFRRNRPPPVKLPEYFYKPGSVPNSRKWLRNLVFLDDDGLPFPASESEIILQKRWRELSHSI